MDSFIRNNRNVRCGDMLLKLLDVDETLDGANQEHDYGRHQELHDLKTDDWKSGMANKPACGNYSIVQYI